MLSEWTPSGGQVIGLDHIGTFRYVAVMSSGWDSEEDRQIFLQNRASADSEAQRALEAVLVACSATIAVFGGREADFIGNEVFALARSGELNICDAGGAYGQSDNWNGIAGRLPARN